VLSHDAAFERLLDIVERIALRGDYNVVAPLLDIAGSSRETPTLAAFAEAIARLVVQLEAREFRLECMIEDLLRVKAELEMANYDPLTGLPNRIIFVDRLRQAMAQSQRSGRALAVFFLDLDRFKAVNDTHGHAVGDVLLAQVAARLRACIRESDTLARLSGDEFACVQPDIDHPAQAEAVAQRFIDSLAAPFELDGVTAEVGTSVGIVLHPRYGADAEELIRLADQAMYRSKSGTGSAYVVHRE
jgi:diguanylate cyclase (GGDEF)-like protein